MKQLTIRNVSPLLAKMIEEERRRRQKSTNQTVLDLLHLALGIGPNVRYDNGLSQLAGTWSEEEFSQFQESVQEFDKIDQELWD
jgi:hypothetical protein